jgi:hypothetical protein
VCDVTQLLQLYGELSKDGLSRRHQFLPWIGEPQLQLLAFDLSRATADLRYQQIQG